ncbi:Protein RTA1 [Vanrija pseudolonga]|uniref:Protein RTA1 n=1 Tax=Vanrija pseudolonga TaxID=143232 RepID=A0AAF1BJG1_9TREE|nr:Protein RTA1 [Vanrija pseudolonga]
MPSRSASYLLVGLAALASVSAAAEQNCAPDPYKDAANDPCNHFRYVPNRALNATACVLYAALGCIFIFNHVRYKAWYFLALTIGTFMMAIGIAVRVAFYYNLHWRGGYIFQQMFIILSPCLLIAANYVLLGRIANHIDAQSHMFIRPARVARVFIISDVITFVIQGGGGGMAAGGGNIANIGVKLLLAGLVAQLVSFGLFSLMWCLFTYRVWRDAVLWNHPGWHALNWVLGFNCIMFLIRSVFRTVEFSQGWTGHLATHEVYWAVLDCLPIFLAISLYTWYWPGRILSPHSQVTRQEFIQMGTSDKSPEVSPQVHPAHSLWA